LARKTTLDRLNLQKKLRSSVAIQSETIGLTVRELMDSGNFLALARRNWSKKNRTLMSWEFAVVIISLVLAILIVRVLRTSGLDAPVRRHPLAGFLRGLAALVAWPRDVFNRFVLPALKLFGCLITAPIRFLWWVLRAVGRMFRFVFYKAWPSFRYGTADWWNRCPGTDSKSNAKLAHELTRRLEKQQRDAEARKAGSASQ
jgi:hypothetical protein